jgi:hypothetical protein
VKVAGATPAVDTIFKAPVPQKQQGEFRKLVFVGASPTRGSSFQGRDVTVSISACDADCAGANPVALTNSFSMGRSFWTIAQPNEADFGCGLTAIRRPDASSGEEVSTPPPAVRWLVSTPI